MLPLERKLVYQVATTIQLKTDKHMVKEHCHSPIKKEKEHCQLGANK
jgi:hypothetical protein